MAATIELTRGHVAIVDQSVGLRLQKIQEKPSGKGRAYTEA